MYMMKKIFLLTVFFAGTVAASFSQGLENVMVERYYISDAADEANAIDQGAVSPLPVGTVAYRIYVDMAPGYKFSQLFGNAEHPLTVNTTTSFYNDPNFGVALNPGAVSQNNTRRHTTMIDSWFTTGGACAGKTGVPENEDTDGTIGNQQGVLANNPGGCYGFPVNGTDARDGMIPSVPGSYVIPNVLGLGNALDVLDQTFGNSIQISNGAIAALGGVTGPTADNRVLIAQFTTSGTLSFSFNLQLVHIATGEAENYVSSDPAAGEQTHPALTFVSGMAPEVSVSDPENNAVVASGDVITITADASDEGGMIAQVDFFVDGEFAGSDATTPFTYTYTATEGVHEIYVVATDNDCQNATSSVITLHVISNQPPVITVSAPPSAVAGSAVMIEANATDPDGTVEAVEFFVNGQSVGVDTDNPYSAEFIAEAGQEQEIYAVATDNFGAATPSASIFIDVNNNILPEANVTYPQSGQVFITLGNITFAADASDSDGIVSEVEFLLNGEFLGVDSEFPYTLDWESSPGTHQLRVMARDDLGGTGYSEEITFYVADPNALPYEVEPVSLLCNAESVCVPVRTSIGYTMSNVIGFDMVAVYDPSKLTPNGTVEISSDLTDPSGVEIVSSIPQPGELYLSVYLTGEGENEFSGTGDILCIGFSKEPEFLASESTEISISSLQESYITGTEWKAVLPGAVTSYFSSEFNSSLLFMNSTLPVAFDLNNPGEYLVTTIIPIDEEGQANISGSVYPDLNGQFGLELYDGLSAQISRDISGYVSVQRLVNGADAVLAKTLLNTGEIQPDIYEIIAMDVNLDGVISAGDISQIHLRATLAIPEYQQAWNYSDEGISNGEPSKDWIFVPESFVQNDPSYQISSLFPADDAQGYSPGRVPQVPFILNLPVTGFSADGSTCPEIGSETYRGIMLGDINGSYLNYDPDGVLRSGTETFDQDTLLYDLAHTLFTDEAGVFYIEIPVLISNTEQMINAVDSWLLFDTEKYAFDECYSVMPGLEVMSHYNSQDHYLRITSSTSGNDDFLDEENHLFYVKLRLLDPCSAVSKNDFSALESLLNGLPVNTRMNENEVSYALTVQNEGDICAGEEVEFSFVEEVFGQSILSYTWVFGNGEISNEQEGVMTYTESGLFNVSLQVFTEAQCIGTYPLQLNIRPLPQVEFGGIVVDGEEWIVEFTNTSSISSGNITSFSWDFGDTQTSDFPEPVHDYEEEGAYTVTLTATSDFGCISSEEEEIEVIHGMKEMEEWEISVFPNPAAEKVSVCIPQNGLVHLTDVNGNKVSETIRLTSGNRTWISMDGLSAGTYHVIVSVNDVMYTKPLILLP